MADNQRRRLIAAIIEIASTKGYTSTTVTDVIATARVSRKAFYAHFSDKQECFLAAYDAIAADWTGKVTKAYSAAEDWPDSAEAGIRAVLEAAVENPGGARLSLVEITAAGTPGIERRERAVAGYERFIRDALGLRLVDDAIVKAVVGGISRILYERALSGMQSELPALAPDILCWVTSYYPPPQSITARPWPASPSSPRPRAGLVGGRAPGTLAPHAPLSEQRGLRRGEHNVSRSFVVHSQRERILDAVANLTAVKGYAALKVESIVEEAAVSLHAFYEHFTDKEDAFLVAYAVGHAKGLGIVERAYAAEPDWRSGVRAAVSALFSYLASEPSFARLALVETLTATPRAVDRSQAGVSSYARLLIPGFDLAAERDGPPAIAIEAITGGLFELCFHYATQGRIQDLPELAIPATYVALAPFIGAEEASQVATEPIGP